MQAERVEVKNVGFVSKNTRTKEEREKRDQEELDALVKQYEAQLEETEETEEKVAETEGTEEGGEEDKPTDSEESTWKKRHGDLRRHSQKREQELKAEIDTLKKSVQKLESQSDVSQELPTDEAELEEWAKKNPDAAKIIQMLASKIADERYATLEEELESVKVSQQAVSRDKAVAKIMKAHPDFEDLQDDDNFHDWVTAQPKMVQDAIYESTDPESVIWGLDRYKETLKKDKKKDTSAAETVKTKERTAPSETAKGKIYESDVQKMDIKTYEKNAEKIQKAIEDGNFVYDISGGAR